MLVGDSFACCSAVDENNTDMSHVAGRSNVPSGSRLRLAACSLDFRCVSQAQLTSYLPSLASRPAPLYKISLGHMVDTTVALESKYPLASTASPSTPRRFPEPI